MKYIYLSKLTKSNIMQTYKQNKTYIKHFGWSSSKISK